VDLLIDENSGLAAKIFLEVRESNSPAIQLYVKKGFDLISRRKNYYPADNGREDALIMVYRYDG
jgi:ribosomal-protein-alanine N-acetyltransferase